MDFFYIIQPLIYMAILSLWVYCIVDALRNHRRWVWVLVLVFVPIVSAPFYLVNFKVFGSSNGEGKLDQLVGENKRLRELQEEARERDVPAVHGEIADIFFRRGDHENSLRSLQRVLDLDPEDLRAQFQAGCSLLAIGKTQMALQHLQYVIDEDPKYSYGEARLALANAYRAMSDDEAAFSHYAEVVQSHNLPEAVVKHARMLRARGETDRAREELHEMLKNVGSLPKDRLANHRRWIKQAAEDLRSLG